jgi:hypothetical protein
MNSPASQIDLFAREANRAASRAHAIMEGLRRTGRTRKVSAAPDDGLAEFIQLERTMPGTYYWIAVDGSEVRAGASFADAAELQPGFVAAMARAGAN